MEMARFVEALEADVAAVAAVGDEQTRAVAERVLHAIRGSSGLRLLEALGDAALEISAQLPEGHIEVRLMGQDPALVYVGEEEAPPEPAACRISRSTACRFPFARAPACRWSDHPALARQRC